MAETPSTMLALGTSVPAFSLPDLNGRMVSDRDFKDADALVIAFLCPHCPYVKHVRAAFGRAAADYQSRKVAVVGINSNDTAAFPEDDAAGMAREAKEAGYTFPYLRDESQDVARAFRAACTPDFFVFDRDRRLVYRGQFDSTRPRGPAAATGEDLRAALDALLAGRAIAEVQRPSVGCNIKWKPGNAPAYA
jgi:peroxiredoxin